MLKYSSTYSIKCSHEYGWWWWWMTSAQQQPFFVSLCWFTDITTTENTHYDVDVWILVCIHIEIVMRPYKTNIQKYVIITAKRERERERSIATFFGWFSKNLMKHLRMAHWMMLVANTKVVLYQSFNGLNDYASGFKLSPIEHDCIHSTSFDSVYCFHR